MEYKQVGAFQLGGSLVKANERNLDQVHSLRPFEALQDWTAYYTPMVPEFYQVTPPSANGSVTHAPLMYYQPRAVEMYQERDRFLRDMRDPRRIYNARKAKANDTWNLMRRKTNESMQYVLPGTPEYEFAVRALEAYRQYGQAQQTFVSFFSDRL